MYIFYAWGLSNESKSNNLAETLPNKDELSKRRENWIFIKAAFSGMCLLHQFTIKDLIILILFWMQFLF